MTPEQSATKPIKLDQRLKTEQLGVFSEGKAPQSEVLGRILEETREEIICFTDSKNAAQADIYGHQIIKAKRFRVEVVDKPVEVAQVDSKHLGLIATSATDPTLKDLMFTNFDLQLFADHNYTPKDGHCSPDLQCIGITNTGLRIVHQTLERWQPDQMEIRKLENQRSERIKSVFGANTLTYVDFRRALHSDRVSEVLIHALGPQGTNISQAAQLYVDQHDLNKKAKVTVHGRGVEPMEYAQIAADEVKEGVIPIHIECAVYYNMGRLFEQRPKEMVFADHHYMPLDTMQFASNIPVSSLQQMDEIRIATHPSPKPLIKPWEDLGWAKWVKASSNSEAAQMVLDGAAHACVTTEQSLRNFDWKPQSQHKFGCPMMIFTFATPLNPDQLRQYL